MAIYLIAIERRILWQGRILNRSRFDLPVKADSEEEALNILRSVAFPQENLEAAYTLSLPNNPRALDVGRIITGIRVDPLPPTGDHE
jgi:hypothetical protein